MAFIANDSFSLGGLSPQFRQIRPSEAFWKPQLSQETRKETTFFIFIQQG